MKKLPVLGPMVRLVFSIHMICNISQTNKYILDDRVKIMDIQKDEEDIRLDVINLAGVELVEQILERIQ